NINLQQKVKLEVQKNNEKEQMLFQQSKMAAMGEMIGNIAHQWRQPISIISMWANNIVADIDMEDIKNENLRRYANNINEQTNHLSKTIDDFRNFFTPNKEKTTFTLKSSIDKTMNLLSASFKTHSIEVIKDVEDITITALENELTQAILNIIKNAKDILITLPKGKRRLIFIDIYKKNNQIILEIKDSGGGVPKDIIDKVFEPYFTTKHKSQGTGIGLYMTESIVTKHLNGEIFVRNVEYNYDNTIYSGAKFIIKIPLQD
ncbi:MAG: HAMP domain-containing sensor histidine kinase, partial [Campylobacterota bacterium]|nr:HAMP domain-containing sensor histidine kinase [Campylobacterota bacterium]